MKDNCLITPFILNNVSFNYGTSSIFQNLNLVINPREFVVLVGPSGSGKTTLLNLLSGHIKPASGTISREGVIRTVYQKDGLFPWLTVWENISIGLRSASNLIEQQDYMKELIKLIHLKGFENHYPHQLSGGMRQRVELARVLVGDSDIILMDEPFSSLDYQTRLHLRSELIRLLANRPRTVILVTHDIEEAAQLADRVLVLSNSPATITREFYITAPCPRGLTQTEVLEAMNLILNELGLNNSKDSYVSNTYKHDQLINNSKLA
jgi:NitT/TauT family transport system ATP-binding protein